MIEVEVVVVVVGVVVCCVVVVVVVAGCIYFVKLDSCHFISNFKLH